MSLIQRFALKTIKNDTEHAQGTRVASELIGRQLESGEADYLDALLVLLNKYEDEHHPIDENLTPRQALLALMEFNGLTQADIGRIIGSESAVSMFLKGDRDLSKSQIKKLAARFKVDAGLFLR
jgi:HTH-type transcriptional regulator/antitoxin HigA